MKVYENEDAKKRVESASSESYSFPFEATIEEDHADKTLKEIGSILTRQFSERGAVGVRLIEIRFSIIYNPKEKG